MYPSLTDDEAANLVKLWRKTRSIKEVSDQTGVHKSTVTRYLRKAGITVAMTRPGSYREQYSEEEAREMARLYVDLGFTTREVAAIHGRGQWTVIQWLDRLGVPRRERGRPPGAPWKKV